MSYFLHSWWAQFAAIRLHEPCTDTRDFEHYGSPRSYSLYLNPDKMAECFVATTEVVDGAAAPELEGLQIAGSEVGEAGAGLDKFEDDAKARIVQDVELSSVIAVSNGGTGTALGTPSASKENTDALAEQNFPCEDAQTHAALSGFLPESAGQVKGNLLGAGILSDGGGQLSKPKPCLLPDSIPVRPCRSSARVSEKERRELENAAREQSQAFELDSRESKERGRKDSKIAPKPCRGALTAPQDEHPDATECRLEKRAEEEEKKKQMVTAGALLGGERMDTGKQPPLGKEAVGAEKEKECAKAGSGDTAG